MRRFGGRLNLRSKLDGIEPAFYGASKEARIAHWEKRNRLEQLIEAVQRALR